MSRAIFYVRLLVLIAATLVCLTLASSSIAQSGYANSHETTPAMHYGAPFGYGHSHASTAAEGFLRGRAAVIEAAGEFEVNDAQAQILREHARALYRENDLKQTEALHLQKKMWNDARVQERKRSLIRAAEGQQLLGERRASVYRNAYQLSPNELNLQTGAITWPAALRDEKYNPNRERVDELFRELVGYGSAEASKAAEVARTVDALSRALKIEIAIIPREEYIAAQKFLLGLKYAAGSAGQTS